jgi:hypothetical protein
MEKKIILLSLRKAAWKVKTAARLLGITLLILRQKLLILMNELFVENAHDIEGISQNHGIPSVFLEAHLKTAANKRVKD